MIETNRSEAEVQAGVISFLKTQADVEWWRVNTGAAKYGDYYVTFGKPGQADLQGYMAPWARMFGIECKREKGGRLTEAQKAWGERLVKFGGIYIVARDVVTVQQAFDRARVENDSRLDGVRR